ncbi:hypothetical protein B0H63DRAFT_519085 [Podospora didyma]|uniref:Uncharacterized protein n=1 Tax=Podospora didyma TaxID=330526 RepID=A0AAE0NYP3_9PEZI|nr:hypothetical protein B0H63DRAFT_519085 [Podospora didyma]
MEHFLSAEPDVDWATKPLERIQQLRRQVTSILEPEANRYVKTLAQKKDAIAALEAQNRQQILDSAKIAYGSLEAVVSALLSIEKGDKPLSRQSETLVAVLDAAADKFSDLSKVSEENMMELGEKAGDCMELGDSAGRFVSDLESKIGALNALISPTFESKNVHDRVLQDKREREGTLRWQLSDAQSSALDVGNAILSWFGSSAVDDAQQRVRDANQALDENLRHQNQAIEDSRRFYRLAIAVRNASAAIFGLKVKVQDMAAEFDAEYSAVTDAQDVENRLCEGLLQLRNHIVSGDWTTTRDKSLQVVLKLLAADDEVLQRQDYFEDAEARIKEAITAVLGDGSVQKLIDGVPLVMEQQLDAALAY